MSLTLKNYQDLSAITSRSGDLKMEQQFEGRL